MTQFGEVYLSCNPPICSESRCCINGGFASISVDDFDIFDLSQFFLMTWDTPNHDPCPHLVVQLELEMGMFVT